MMKFLIVDDRTENLYLLESLLKGSGYEVVTAGNGAEALEKLHGENFDMIISDILMPVMDGFQLCIKVKTDKNLREIPLIFYTATYTDEKDEEAALKMGADRFIRKPAEPDELIKTIRGMIRNAAKGKKMPSKPVLKEEKDTFKLYSERLVKKLEKKMLDLEREIAERNKFEEALKESEEKYRAFFDTSRDCAFITVQEGKLLDINNAGVELFGFEGKEECLKVNVRNLYENPEERKEHLKLIVKQGFAKDYPVNLIKKDGRIINSLITSVAKRDIYGNITGFQGIIRDITDKKRAEEELKESYVRFKTVMDNIDAFIYVADMNTYEILYVNKYGRDIWGEIEGNICWQTIQSGQSGPCHFCSNEKLLDKYGNPTGVYKWEFQNTVTGHWYDCRDSAIRWLDGQIVRIEIATDITERKKTEEALRESEEKYRAIFESAAEGILIADIETKNLKYANPAICKMLGYTEEELQSLKISDIHPREELENILSEFEAQACGEKPLLPEISFLSKDGTIIYADIQTTGANIFIDESSCSVGCITDVTERRQAESKLKQSYEKLEGALGGIINALAATSEWRDPYTAGHQKRVAELARAIAEEMNLSEKQIGGIHMSALIHDVGKINVPAEILSKPGHLADFEFEMIKTHPQVCYDILKDIEFPWPIAQTILQHHERMDGSGYPEGLSGKKICLEARILAVADVIEAMSSHRPYRPALTIDEALEEISHNKGILYDPDVVDACLKIFADKRFKLE